MDEQLDELKTLIGGMPILVDEEEEPAGMFEAEISRLMESDRFLTAIDALEKQRRSALGSGTIHECDFHKVVTRFLQIDKGTRFRDVVLFFAVLAAKKYRTRKDWERLWALGTGKMWKQLTEFPGRLRGMAEEIECLNGSYVCGLESWTTITPTMKKSEKLQFSRLAASMRLFATRVEARTKQIPTLTRQKYPSRPRGYSPFFFHISALVKSGTGGFRDGEVAELLNAADRAMNPRDPDSKDIFHPQTLCDLRSRLKRKTHKT
jgi:hypothetical protein